MKLKKIFSNIIIFFVFLLIFLVLLEISLTIAGKILTHYKKSSNVNNLYKEQNIKISCFGDSYTYGGLGIRSTSYPAFLNRLCENIHIENAGVCESNSTQVLNDIKESLNAHDKPLAIIVLVGASNKYNNYGMEKIYFFQKFKIYKMIKILYLSINNMYLKKNIENDEKDNFIDEPRSGYYLFSDINTVISDLKKIDNRQGVIKEIHNYMAKSYFRTDSNKIYKETKNRVENLLNTLTDEQKKVNASNMIEIYGFLNDKEQIEYYYNYIAKINLVKANKNMCDYLVSLYYDFDNGKEKKEIVEHIIKLNPKLGYEKQVDYYIRKIPYVKDDTEKEKMIRSLRESIDKYFLYEKDENKKNQVLALYYINTFDFDNAIKIFEEKIKGKDISFDEYFYLKIAYASVYCNKFSDAVFYFLQSLKCTSQDYYVYANAYYYLMKSFELQNTYSADYVLKEFDEIIKRKPGLKENELIASTYKMFGKKSKFEQEVLQWLERDLNAIIDICSQNGVKLMLQTYPFPYNSVNELIRKVCKNRNIDLIEQDVIFKELVDKYGYSEYFLDFDHCTPKGHETMAQNVYEYLVQNKVIYHDK